ncbi:Na-K-Cl cotransporter [Balneola sp. MJW-20]|uniref:Na-K-Cl cotransporter n=1 Tax=Gracilimonas aurantiaca TaxID=3234185 RepID=UPI0034659ED0
MINNAKQYVLPSREGGLGTFGGVFTPSILTILGVIMYLRFGWVVGNVGLIGTLIIVTLSTSITFLTSLSIASIATDQRVRIGGAYYMISRSLGIESGGAIGIPLYFAQALSVALYTVGFAESVVRVFPGLAEKWVGVITTVLVAGLALASAKAAIRAQYVIMIGIALSLISLIFGSPLENSNIEMWGASQANSEGFWTVFAVFFPAVTGIMAGVNMSGDLENPNKSIPTGTFAAIGVGYVIYMGLPVILASRADALTLINDPLIMRKMAFWGDAILIGVWGATLSSAVGSILGAPRVLQALAKDGILPDMFSFLAKGSGKDDTPRIGTMFTLGVALIAVWFGDLNLIAPVLTMFFLTTYGVLNIAAGTEKFLGSPSFRPKFKVHWFFSLLGAVGCIAVMFLINTGATITAMIFVAIIFAWLKRREMESAWGDIGRGIWMAVTRAGLMRLSEDLEPKSWRPNPLVLAGSPTKRWHLIEFANNLTHDRGILSVASVLSEGNITTEQMYSMKANIKEFLSRRGIQGLVKLISSKDRYQGVTDLVQSYGLGALEPNTIIIGDSDEVKYRHEFCSMIKRFYELQRNVLIVKKGSDFDAFGRRKRIDVWWGGLKGNGGLMMILAYLISSSLDWREAHLHIKMVIDDEDAIASTRHNIEQVLEEIRIDAKADIIYSDGRSFDEILLSSSAESDLVFLGIKVPDGNFEEYYSDLQKRIAGLPTTVLALAAQEVSFGEVLIQKDTMQDN